MWTKLVDKASPTVGLARPEGRSMRARPRLAPGPRCGGSDGPLRDRDLALGGERNGVSDDLCDLCGPGEAVERRNVGDLAGQREPHGAVFDRAHPVGDGDAAHRVPLPDQRVQRFHGVGFGIVGVVPFGKIEVQLEVVDADGDPDSERSGDHGNAFRLRRPGAGDLPIMAYPWDEYKY